MLTRTVWGIHAGHTGEADTLFLEKKVVAIGWSDLGNLADLGKTREAIKQRVAETYPHRSAGYFPVVAGVIFRFLNEMAEGDYVLYPRKADRTIHLGKIAGPFAYRPDLVPGYPNVRPVEWIGQRPRSAFSQSALYEIGSALSLFQVKEHAEEFLAVLTGKAALVERPESPEEDHFAEVIEANIEDFILSRLEVRVKGHALEHFVADLLQAMGYHTTTTKASGDGGVDVIASKGPFGFEPPVIRAQVKSTTGSISDSTVKQLMANVNDGEFGLLITLGSFTKPARDWAAVKPNLSLVDGPKLVQLIQDHYEGLSPSSQAVIPLARRYVPDLGD